MADLEETLRFELAEVLREPAFVKGRGPVVSRNQTFATYVASLMGVVVFCALGMAAALDRALERPTRVTLLPRRRVSPATGDAALALQSPITGKLVDVNAGLKGGITRR